MLDSKFSVRKPLTSILTSKMSRINKNVILHHQLSQIPVEPLSSGHHEPKQLVIILHAVWPLPWKPNPYTSLPFPFHHS